MSLLLRLLGLLLHWNRGRAYERARGSELAKIPATRSPVSLMDDVRARLAGPRSLAFGSLPSGAAVRVRSELAFRSALIVGASGSGKTRFLLGLLRELFVWALQGLIEVELVDPKSETFDLACQALAALYLRGDSTLRECLRQQVQVFDWSREAVSPFAPFHNASGFVSNAFLAHLRTDAIVQASPQAYSESLKQALFMLAWLLTEKDFPPNLRFATRLLSDPLFRQKVLADVGEPQLRAYYLDLDHNLAPATAGALLRRLQHDLSFPEVRLSIGIPPADLLRLRPSRDRRIVLGNFGSGMALPPSVSRERAAHRVTDVLLRAPQRDPRRPGALFLEEAPKLLAGGGELIEPLSTAARTLRSVGLGIVFCGQDVANALPAPLVRTLQLNTWWWAIFRSHEEAEWIYPHLLPDDSLAALSEGDRHREFRRSMAGLGSRRYYLLVKGESALPVLAPTVPDPAIASGRGKADLSAVFRKEIASQSMVPAAQAAALIERWEAEVVDKAVVPPTSRPNAKGTVSNTTIGGIADLLAALGKRGA